jgi:cell division septal protein FtsQ
MTSDYSSYSLDYISGVPTLINYVTSDVEKDFVKKLNRIDDNIIKLVSEIEYTPNDFDQKRFLLYMNDGNLVYVTVTKLELLNKYVDIVKQLNNKNGILYLDSGNYFEIKE